MIFENINTLIQSGSFAFTNVALLEGIHCVHSILPVYHSDVSMCNNIIHLASNCSLENVLLLL